MELSLQNLQINPKSRKNRKRVGRGNASGHGTYSTRGLKGQKARSGGSKGLKRRAMVKLLRSKPKIGGFRSPYDKMVIVNLKDLDKNFENGEIINASKLLAKGLIKNNKTGLKILGDGKLTKKFSVAADAFSNSAKEAIIKAGGKAQKIGK